VSLDDFPIWDKNSELATLTEVAFEHAVAQAGSFVVQQRDRRDYGTDFQLATKQSSGPTNYRVHIQLKGTDKPVNKDGSISMSVSSGSTSIKWAPGRKRRDILHRRFLSMSQPFSPSSLTPTSLWLLFRARGETADTYMPAFCLRTSRPTARKEEDMRLLASSNVCHGAAASNAN
jgi:hypothetical protein